MVGFRSKQQWIIRIVVCSPDDYDQEKRTIILTVDIEFTDVCRLKTHDDRQVMDQFSFAAEPKLVLGLALLGKLCILGASFITILYSIELFPTVIRYD